MSIRITSLSSNKIRQYDADPTNPGEETAWVLRTLGAAPTTVGVPIGLLLSLTYSSTGAGGATTYQFSYRTKEGTTLRTSLS